MPILVRWVDETKRILLTEYVGAYTREESQKTQEERKLLYANFDYPIGIIEDESQGYLVHTNEATRPQRLPGRHIYTSSTDFSVENMLQPNRVAVTIKIPYALDAWESDKDGEMWNAHSREKLESAFEYPTLASVSVMMTIDPAEAHIIIVDYLTKLEAQKRAPVAV
ncbi:MAG: hypothetical protein LCI00_05885 [Chloroflexi bacterium]|nr:hypothetical protein [Chloroflexota bacterium]MCC6891878.1 hypothetical protein [Anaerolineae bacterium]